MSGSLTPHPVPISALLEPEYLLDLVSMTMDELRHRRTQCALVESSVSYERQLIQGRLDIVRDEQDRRDRQLEVDVEGNDLVERLPLILTLHARVVGMGRPPTFMFPVHLDLERQERMHRVAPASALATLPAQSGDAIAVMASLLEAMEQEISAQRRALHGVFDQIQAEVIRRYKSGEAAIEGASVTGSDEPSSVQVQLHAIS
jgi:hypothetical protein